MASVVAKAKARRLGVQKGRPCTNADLNPARELPALAINAAPKHVIMAHANKGDHPAEIATAHQTTVAINAALSVRVLRWMSGGTPPD